ncbi:hypothetical protein GQ457_09G017890 [Hibiscus cannabinus]
MADSLLVKLGDLTFTAEEQDAIVVAPDSVAIPAEDFASSLVGKVVSPPTVDGGRLIRQFRSIWKDDKMLTISEINPNFFLISFASPANRANVLKRGPWDFQKYWFALEQADLNRTYPRLFLSSHVHLGASIGKVIMTDTRLEDGNMGEFMRVRVLIDTSKPLRQCVVLSRPDAKASMCPLQYERLPLFCHGCGLIGHSVLACPTTPKVEGQKFQYGAWLRAPLPKRSATRPRGRLSVVDDDLDVPVSVDSATEGPSARPGLRHWQCTKRATEWERIPRLKSEINRLSSRRLSPQGLEVLLAAKGELSHMLKVQEAYWAQRSRSFGFDW